MNVEFYIEDDLQGFPQIFMKAYENGVLVKDSMEINLSTVVDLIPDSTLIEYRNLLKDKVLESLSNNYSVTINMYLYYLSVVNNYLEEDA
jgi:hypothetical protein